MSVSVYLKSKLWHTAKNIATFLITKELSCERRQDVGQWSHSLIWRIRSLVQAQGHTLATAVGLSPGHRHPTGWDSVSPDIDVMWKKNKLSLLSDATKLNTSLPLFLCLFLCLIYRASRSSSRGECGTSFYYLILVLFFYSLSSLFWLCFCWQALTEVWETCVYTAQSVRGSVCRAFAVQSVEIHERKHLSRYFKGILWPHLPLQM